MHAGMHMYVITSMMAFVSLLLVQIGLNTQILTPIVLDKMSLDYYPPPIFLP